MALSRASILASKPRIFPAAVPEWGGTLNFKPLSVAQLIQFLDARDKLQAAELYPLLVALSACDDDGEPLFTVEDLEALKAKDFDLLKRLGDVALKLNKLTDDEDTVKN